MKKLLLVIIVLFSYPVFAQKTTNLLKGKVIDHLNKPVFYATAALYKTLDSSLVKGALTNENGDFSIETSNGNYYLKISFISLKDQIIPDINLNNNRVNLGDIKLEESTLSLDEVEITATRNLVELQLDKKIIHVSDQNTNAGETAVEILSNTPSVQTDFDGNITLRGSSSFTLLINGVPTAMNATDALQTIPASSIENIEIITNPSAKYDAEGNSGIINIITKKNTLEGLSLSSSLTAGTFNNHRGDISLSYSKNNFLINVGGNIGRSERPRDIDKTRTTITDSSVSVIKSLGEGAWIVNSQRANAEIQWSPKNHTITLAGRYTKRKMTPYFYLDFQQFQNNVEEISYQNRQDNLYDIVNSSLRLYYSYKIKGDNQHTITVKAINNQHDVDQLDSAIHYNESNELIGGTIYTETGPSDFVRFNIDYERPLNTGKFETGAQAQIGSSGDNGKSFFYNDTTKTFVFNDQFSSNVDYVRNIYAGYAIFRSTYEKLSYQIGLRGEYTYRTVSSQNFSDFITINRMDWFPSVHLSYNINDEQQLMVNYSRRIQRPKSWFFEPFVIWETAFNVRSGNPDLTPEYINNFEINWTRPLSEKGFLTLETYYKNTFGIINRVSSVYEENVIITRPFNTGTSNAVGIEASIKYYLTKNWEINNAFDLFYNQLSGLIDNIPYSNNAFRFNNRLTNTFSFNKNWKLQLVTRYNSPFNTPQGDKKGFFVLDASIKKTFQEGKYALNLQGSNLLGTEVNNYTLTNQNLLLNRINTPKFPIVKLTFSMRLNNYKKISSHHEDADEF